MGSELSGLGLGGLWWGTGDPLATKGLNIIVGDFLAAVRGFTAVMSGFLAATIIGFTMTSSKGLVTAFTVSASNATSRKQPTSTDSTQTSSSQGKSACTHANAHMRCFWQTVKPCTTGRVNLRSMQYSVGKSLCLEGKDCQRKHLA